MTPHRHPPYRHALLVLACLATVACGPKPADDDAATPAIADFVGGAACVECHADQAEAWRGSHHDLAMQQPNATTVLGDFDDATFTHEGVTSTFFRDGDGFRVRTDGPDGTAAEFEVVYVFGVTPLQQYLVALPGGRLQALTAAWDTRPEDAGGQRWFSIYAEPGIDSRDPLHWTGVYQNWNASCAFCHSTALEKRYSPDTDVFETHYTSIDVDCEACHGPGSLHAAAPEVHDLQLAADRQVRWNFEPGATIAQRQPASAGSDEIETCAACHSRRGQLVDRVPPGTPMLDAFRPATLESRLYYADGQILEEVYVWGSFQQSRMHAAGVTCSDCHDAHSVGLRADGDAVCARCHLASTYEVASHHRHEPGAAGSRCVDCHMPARNYMVVDPRRDHSFRVPRPDLSVTLGTPNACTGCHAGRDDAWAADAVESWFPQGRSGTPHYAEAIFAGRHWTRDRVARLSGLIADPSQPAIVRATAITLLTQQPERSAPDILRGALAGDEPLVQLAALESLGALPALLRAELATPLLTHPLLALRLEAARQLIPVRQELRQQDTESLERAVVEYRRFLDFNADRPEGLLQLAALYVEFARQPEAENLLRTLTARHPWFAAGYVNLADLLRQTGRDAEALAVLEEAVRNAADDPASHYALGLALVRAGRSDDAVPRLAEAARLAPDSPYYAYIHAVALHSTGDTEQALSLLRVAQAQFPGYRDTVSALATMHRDAGNRTEALDYARRLLELTPGDAQVLSLIDALDADE